MKEVLSTHNLDPRATSRTRARHLCRSIFGFLLLALPVFQAYGQIESQVAPYVVFDRGDQGEPWFVPAERLGDYLKLDLPSNRRIALESLLEKSCDFQALGPKDSALCFREPRPYQTQLQRLEEELADLKAEDARTGQRRGIVHNLEQRLEVLRSEPVVINSCSGLAMHPSKPQAANPGERLNEGLVLIGRIISVKPGWNSFSAELASIVRVSVESTLLAPPGTVLPAEVWFLEPRARFEVGALQICSGEDASTSSQPGTQVLIRALGWSTTGQELESHLVFEIQDGRIVRDFLSGAEITPSIELASLSLNHPAAR